MNTVIPQQSSPLPFMVFLRHAINAVAVLLMFYLLVRTRTYEVTWTWAYLLPSSWLMQINVFFNYIGTLILIVPMSITAAHYMLPEIMILRMSTAIFNAGFGLYFLVQFIKQGGHFDNVKNILFTIHHVSTLEDKIACFMEAWDKLLKPINTIPRYEFLQNYLESNISGGLKNTISNTKLKLIPDLAHSEFMKATALFEETLKPSDISNANKIINWMVDHKRLIFGITTIICAVILYSYFKSSSLIIDAQKKSNNLMETSTENTTQAVNEAVVSISKTAVETQLSVNAVATAANNNTEKQSIFNGFFFEMLHEKCGVPIDKIQNVITEAANVGKDVI